MAPPAEDYTALFDINLPSKTAKYKNCSKTYTFHPQETGYSTLKRHYQSNHEEIFARFSNKRQGGSDTGQISLTKYFKAAKVADFSVVQKLALSFCTAAHPIPLNYYEDQSVT